MRRPLITATLAVVTALTVLTTACSAPILSRSAPPEPEVTTDVGRLRGVADGDVNRFLGVPFAEPPVGPQRWTAPRPVRPWPDVRAATQSGSACAQPAGQLPAQVLEEDCLYLDVTTPVESAAPRPVMVWVHGGSLNTGTGAQYDPRQLVVDGDVVVVTINYRLGAFGLAALPDMDEYGGSFGLSDQQEALRFVQRNAAAFGGDPNNVTLFGESGGAVSTCAQLMSPAARGLFHRAILQSAVGACGDPIEPGSVAVDQPRVSNFASRAAINRDTTAIAAELGCKVPETVLACMRELPAETFVSLGQVFSLPAYRADNPVLPQSPAQAVALGDVAQVPVLAGFTSDEASFGLAQSILAGAPDFDASTLRRSFDRDYGDRAAEVAERYPVADFASANEAWVAVHSSSGWACPALALNDQLADRGPVFAFEFADSTMPPPFPFPPSVRVGATHGAELAFLFNLRPEYLPTGVEVPAFDERQRQLSERLIATWARFAHTGNPGTPRWDRRDRSGSVFGGADPIGNLWSGNNCDLWNQ